MQGLGGQLGGAPGLQQDNSLLQVSGESAQQCPHCLPACLPPHLHAACLLSALLGLHFALLRALVRGWLVSVVGPCAGRTG